jgi:hypothetical protein
MSIGPFPAIRFWPKWVKFTQKYSEAVNTSTLPVSTLISRARFSVVFSGAFGPDSAIH